MIASLRGTLRERQPDRVVVECGGVGYDVAVPLSTLPWLPEVGSEVTLRVFTHAQENKIALFGFYTAAERQLFDLLITVKNVGPTTALAILSGAPAPEFLARTIAAGDVAALTRIRGVGKKTADLLVVELREKCEALIATWGVAAIHAPGDADADGERRGLGVGPMGVGRRSTRSPLLDDVQSALVNMGWRPAEVDKVLSQMEVPPSATLETLLRDTLRSMSR
jgi:holliday junction DNA helicase RuvA